MTPEFFARGVALFDFDGTLVDSSPAHEEAFLLTLREVSPDTARTFEYDEYRGQRTLDVFEALGLRDPSLVDRKQQRYREAVGRGAVRVFDGAVELLELLSRAGKRLGLVTGGSRRSTEAALAAAGLAGRLAVIVTGDDVERGKPDPDGYQTALRRFECAPADAFAVEDASSGIAAARSAKVYVVGVGDAIEAAAADAHFGTLRALFSAAEGALSGHA